MAHQHDEFAAGLDAASGRCIELLSRDIDLFIEKGLEAPRMIDMIRVAKSGIMPARPQCYDRLGIDALVWA